jgi:hypothetical protein
MSLFLLCSVLADDELKGLRAGCCGGFTNEPMIDFKIT